MDYPMGIRTNASKRDVSSLLADLLRTPNVEGTFRLAALECTLASAEERPLPSAYEEVLGAPADIQVYWLLDHKADDPEQWHRARQTMVVTSAHLVDRLDADAVLTLGLERILLTRRRGVLEVHDWFPEFREAEVAARLPEHRTTTDPGNL